MKIAIASDHAGFEYKEIIIKHLKTSHQVENFGTKSLDSVDYPDFIHPCANAVENQKAELGIIICGSGNGAQITANKHQGIRAALCWNTELAALARQHNDANIISIPSRFVSPEMAIQMVDSFLATPFEGGRHQDRVNKIKCC
jgi:ribose 5-phosphate isomerase B